jgi:hypothetical protein
VIILLVRKLADSDRADEKKAMVAISFFIARLFLIVIKNLVARVVL